MTPIEAAAAAMRKAARNIPDSEDVHDMARLADSQGGSKGASDLLARAAVTAFLEADAVEEIIFNALVKHVRHYEKETLETIRRLKELAK